jgi:hypothetical protein
LTALGLGALAYLSLRPSAFLTEVGWIPRWLSQWADHHGVLRNAVAFLALGLFVFTWVGRRLPHALALAAFAIVIEVPQIWLPQRVFDGRDIGASLGGIGLAWLLVWVARQLGRLRGA